MTTETELKERIKEVKGYYGEKWEGRLAILNEWLSDKIAERNKFNDIFNKFYQNSEFGVKIILDRLFFELYPENQEDKT